MKGLSAIGSRMRMAAMHLLGRQQAGTHASKKTLRALTLPSVRGKIRSYASTPGSQQRKRRRQERRTRGGGK